MEPIKINIDVCIGLHPAAEALLRQLFGGYAAPVAPAPAPVLAPAAIPVAMPKPVAETPAPAPVAAPTPVAAAPAAPAPAKNHDEDMPKMVRAIIKETRMRLEATEVGTPAYQRLTSTFKRLASNISDNRTEKPTELYVDQIERFYAACKELKYDPDGSLTAEAPF